MRPNNSTEDPNLSEANVMENRKKRMLERLNARHAQSGSSKISGGSEETEGKNFDEIQMRANSLMEDRKAIIDSAFLEEIESALALLPAGLRSRRLRDAYNELRSRLQQQRSGVQSKSAFSFSTKQSSKPVSHQNEMSSASDAVDSTPLQITLRSKDSITIVNKEKENIEVKGNDGQDVTVMDVSDCYVVIPFKASTIHLKKVIRCTVIISPVDSSILIRDCENLTMSAAAQQIRIHNSNFLKLHVAVRAAVIIEDCNNVEVAPYRVKGICLEWHNDNWKEVKDFNWLNAKEKSPHWSVMDENLWDEFSLICP